MCCKSEARGSRRKKVTCASPTNYQERQVPKQIWCFLPQLTAEEGRIHSWCMPSFQQLKRKRSIQTGPLNSKGPVAHIPSFLHIFSPSCIFSNRYKNLFSSRILSEIPGIRSCLVSSRICSTVRCQLWTWLEFSVASVHTSVQKFALEGSFDHPRQSPAPLYAANLQSLA